jgi:hypothetical protein
MARSQLLSLREAADRLASHGVGQHLTAVGAPPIARRSPKARRFADPIGDGDDPQPDFVSSSPVQG